MIEFILNNKHIRCAEHPGMSLLDFIRQKMDLPGTKSGCREGDCGACTVIEGFIKNDKVQYKTIVSCLTPLGNVHGKHIVTIEGLNMRHLSPAQKAIVDHGGTQCGFCTPGFVVSLTAHSMQKDAANQDKAIAAIDGNICRCTGYKSIEQAALSLAASFKVDKEKSGIESLIQKKYLPAYFLGIYDRLSQINPRPINKLSNKTFLSGGTDLLVQIPDRISEENLLLLSDEDELKEVWVEDGLCTIGGATTASEISESAELQACFPKLQSYFKLISSTPIRNMGTLGGNLVNASPIGDLSIFFLALNADLTLQNSEGELRYVLLKNFFLDYKIFDLKENEIVKSLSFKLPQKKDYFNFEKVSKRQHLDIASVNTAVLLLIKDRIIMEASISAGGVSPIPLFLKKTSSFLIGRKLEEETLIEANLVLQQEISPISDIRGQADYKRLLLRQLFYAHFINLESGVIDLKKLLK